jgi:transposase InsO family protein
MEETIKDLGDEKNPDLFSRKIVGWEVHACESVAHAVRLFHQACRREGGRADT